MYAARSIRRTVAGVLAAVGLVFVSSCSTEAETNTGDPAALTATVSAVAQPPTEVVDADGPNFTRVEQSTYDIDLGDTESAVFTSGDGSIHCSFTAEHGQYNYPQKMFAIDETIGTCLYGMENAGGSAQFVSINTDAAVQSTFAEPRDTITPTFPGAPATLARGEFVHLGKLGCFAPTDSEITCTKFTTGEAFTIKGGSAGSGFTGISEAEVINQLTDAAGRTQVLSRVIDLPLEEEDGIRCFYDTTIEGRYSCTSVDPSDWDSTEGPGPANMLTWQLQDGDADFVRAFAANPGFDIYESRQPLEPGRYLLDSGLMADYDGTQVSFTTVNGDSFWVDGLDHGTRQGSQQSRVD